MLGIELYPRQLYKFSLDDADYVAMGVIVPTHDLLPRTAVDIRICIKETSGEVFLVEPDAKYRMPLVFVNTSVVTFLLFLMTCLHHTPQMKKLAHEQDDLIHRRVTKEDLLDGSRSPHPRKDYDEILDALRKELLEIDPIALSKFEYYWSSVLFDWSI